MVGRELTDVERAIDESEPDCEPIECFALPFGSALVDEACLWEGHVDDLEEEVGGEGGDGGALAAGEGRGCKGECMWGDVGGWGLHALFVYDHGGVRGGVWFYEDGGVLFGDAGCCCAGPSDANQ